MQMGRGWVGGLKLQIPMGWDHANAGEGEEYFANELFTVLSMVGSDEGRDIIDRIRVKSRCIFWLIPFNIGSYSLHQMLRNRE